MALFRNIASVYDLLQAASSLLGLLQLALCMTRVVLGDDWAYHAPLVLVDLMKYD